MSPIPHVLLRSIYNDIFVILQLKAIFIEIKSWVGQSGINSFSITLGADIRDPQSAQVFETWIAAGGKVYIDDLILSKYIADPKSEPQKDEEISQHRLGILQPI